MRKILLTGVTGQVGWELQRSLSTLGKVISAGRDVLDMSKPESLPAAIRRIRPDVIVNPAAYTAVDQAESERELAYAVNATAPGVLAEAAAEQGIPVIHFSTDYVFDGEQSTPYSETDATNPLGVYGASKLAGEQAVQASGADYLILRTSWVYGRRGKNFLLTMQRLARERDLVRVVNDQFGAPTWSRSIADATGQILSMWLSPGTTAGNRSELSGIYHLACAGRTSWHGFASAIFESMQNTSEHIARLEAITTSEYPVAARRPVNSILSCEKLHHAFGISMPSWDDALKLCLP